MAMEEETCYFAFISYDWRDQDIAKDLHQFLEDYEIPEGIRAKRPDLPPDLRPLFMDTEDLSIGSGYEDKLREAVRRSDYFIAVCSEHSAKPNPDTGNHYVEDGIRFFLELDPVRNVKRVVPIIVRGHNDGRVEERYLPPSIRERKILAADIGVSGKQRAFSDVVAGLLSVPKNTLWRGWERRNMPQIQYCKDYVECNNIPLGVGVLTRKQMAARRSHYRISTLADRVLRVEHCNSAGTLIPHENEWEKERPAVIEMEYSAQGVATRRVHLDEHRQPIVIWNFHPSGNSISFDTPNGCGMASVSSFLHVGVGDEDDGDSPYAGNVVSFEVERDAKGRIIKEMFCNSIKAYCRNKNGVWGRSYERDEETGQIRAVRYLGRNGTDVCIAKGVCGYLLERDAGGEVIRMVLTGVDGKSPVPEKNAGWASMEIIRNFAGNIEEKSYWDRDGNLCFLKKRGEVCYHRIRFEYDSCGYPVQLSCYGSSGLMDGWNSSAITRIRYDGQGRKIQEFYQSAQKAPWFSRDTIREAKFHYDTEGRLTEVSSHDAEGRLNQGKRSYAKVTLEYDAQGHLILKKYYGEDDRPCIDPEWGSAGRRWTYNAAGQEESMTHLGVDGTPGICMFGYVMCKCVYDSRGNTSEEWFCGKDGSLMEIGAGYSKNVYMYDETGNCTEVRHVCKDGSLVPKGVARVCCVYDPQGNWVERAQYNAQGDLYSDYDCPKWTAEYDEWGRQTKKTRLGTDGGLYAESNEPCAVWTKRYDKWGHVTDEAYYGVDGGLCKADVFSSPKTVRRYNDKGLLTLEAHYGTDNKLCPSPFSGPSMTVREYNDKGLLTLDAYYGTDGKPVQLRETAYARKVLEYDEAGRLRVEKYYGADGMPCMYRGQYARVEYSYGDGGGRHKKYFDSQDAPLQDVGDYVPVFNPNMDRMPASGDPWAAYQALQLEKESDEYDHAEGDGDTEDVQADPSPEEASTETKFEEHSNNPLLLVIIVLLVILIAMVSARWL